ncbi:MAG: 3',5'-cyclic-nucleotide phosphodiesterase [Gammaproteobacteria bacterium]|nr:3',5'-cyclic-nucleotide phosphodiesterase [Gammaproteobacteria bacterium]MCK5262671.1 3',5'-cyclic-nucleotide phosphodiesterase [Gammaproteobacteria bacterium]
MKIRVLGCSGGIAKGVATTSFLIDDDILIDAGTGVGDLSIREMQRIKHIFITHSHLDHVCSIALLADTLFDKLVGQPITVHAERSTIKALREHIFNWTIWPDFTVLPKKSNAVLKLKAMTKGSTLEIKGRSIEMIRVNHAVPGVAYRVESQAKSFAFSGDTNTNNTLWAALNKHDNLDLFFVESAFANKDAELAELARHYCPKTLAEDLPKLKHRPKVCISHLKPGDEKRIMKECQEALPDWKLHQLKSDDRFKL